MPNSNSRRESAYNERDEFRASIRHLARERESNNNIRVARDDKFSSVLRGAGTVCNVIRHRLFCAVVRHTKQEEVRLTSFIWDAFINSGGMSAE